MDPEQLRQIEEERREPEVSNVRGREPRKEEKGHAAQDSQTERASHSQTISVHESCKRVPSKLSEGSISFEAGLTEMYDKVVIYLISRETPNNIFFLSPFD